MGWYASYKVHVWKNGVRRPDREDQTPWLEEEFTAGYHQAFGEGIPGTKDPRVDPSHAVIGDGDWRLTLKYGSFLFHTRTVEGTDFLPTTTDPAMAHTAPFTRFALTLPNGASLHGFSIASYKDYVEAKLECGDDVWFVRGGPSSHHYSESRERPDEPIRDIADLLRAWFTQEALNNQKITYEASLDEEDANETRDDR